MSNTWVTALEPREKVPGVMAETKPTFDVEQLLAECSTAADMLSFWARRRNDALAYVFLKDGEIEDASLTFGALEARARAVAGWLRERGATGERALLLYPPGLDFLIAFFGCLQAGVVAVPVYPPRPNRRDSRVVDVTNDSTARFALTTRDITATLERAVEHSPELGALQWCATDTLHLASGETVDTVQAADADDVAYLQYTSGSTRSPRGVVVTHGNVLAQLRDLELAGRHPRDSVFVTW